MATLDKVIDMQKRGLSETEISTQLRNDGLSPQEITDSLNQAKIKGAVSPFSGTPTPPDQRTGMQQSIMPPATPGTPEATMFPGVSPPQSSPGLIKPMTQEIPGGSPQPLYPPQPPTQEPMMPPAEVYPPETPQGEYEEDYQDDYYPETTQEYQDDYYYPQQGFTDTETISEIAEQVVLEKLGEFKKKTGDIALFKTTIQDKVTDIDDRLKRIEASIDKLQQAVIGKIGEFGENSEMIHKDLENLHGTVSKLMDPLIDNYNELKKIAK